MVNPLYQQMLGMNAAPSVPSGYSAAPASPMFQNPIQKMQYIMQAMTNPVAFVRQKLPNIPGEAFNDPSGRGVLQYMMDNMGVTQQDVQNAAAQIPAYR